MDQEISSSQGLLQPLNNNKTSTGKLPSNNSLAMLKMLENFRLSAQKNNENEDLKGNKDKISRNKRHGALNKTEED